MTGSNNRITVYRMNAGAKEAYSGTPVIQDAECYLEQLDPQVAIIMDGQNAYTTFRAYMDGVFDIKSSDKVVDAQGRTYIVGGVQVYENNIDAADGTEVTMSRKYTKASV